MPFCFTRPRQDQSARRFCQGSRHRPWLRRARLGIGPPFMKGADAVLGMRIQAGQATAPGGVHVGHHHPRPQQQHRERFWLVLAKNVSSTETRVWRWGPCMPK